MEGQQTMWGGEGGDFGWSFVCGRNINDRPSKLYSGWCHCMKSPMVGSSSKPKLANILQIGDL